MGFDELIYFVRRMAHQSHEWISRRVLALLKERNLTQAKLAELAGMKPGYLSELISGKAGKRWNSDLLDDIARAIGVSPDALLCEYTAEERRLIERYRTLRDNEQEAFETLMGIREE